MKTLLMFLLAASILFAGTYEPNQTDQQIIAHTFNEEYGKAKNTCNEQIKLNPHSPKYYYYLVNVKILEYYQRVAELDRSKRDEGRKALNKEIIEYCESVLEKFEDSKLSIENKFYYGTIHGYIARVYGMDGSWYSAFKSAKKAKSIMEEIIKTDPDFYDAHLVLGMIDYYADRMSGVAGFFAGVLGLSGDREKGLNHLKLAYEKGKLTFGQTALTLIEVNTSLEGNDYAAFPYFEKFLKQYPNNRRTMNSYFHTLLNIWEVKKAESLIKNDHRKLLDDFAHARFYNIRGESKPAIQSGERALGNENKLYRGGGNAVRYIIAFNSWLIGDIIKQNKYETELDNFYKEIFSMAKKYRQESMWLHNLSVQIASGKPVNEIENFIKSKPNLSIAKGYEDQFNNLVGTFYFINNLNDKAVQYFQKTLNAADERDKNTSLRYLVEIYMKQNVDRQKVKNLLSVIEDSENDRLSYRSKDLKKKYNI